MGGYLFSLDNGDIWFEDEEIQRSLGLPDGDILHPERIRIVTTGFVDGETGLKEYAIVGNDGKDLGIPKVKVLDPDGRVLTTGWYFEFPERSSYAMDNIQDMRKIKLVRGIVSYDPGDWGMKNIPRMLRIDPPLRIVPISAPALPSPKPPERTPQDGSSEPSQTPSTPV